jgi:hypothetical protein
MRRKKHVLKDLQGKEVTLSMNFETTPWPFPKLLWDKMTIIKDIRFHRFLDLWQIDFCQLVPLFTGNLPLCTVFKSTNIELVIWLHNMKVTRRGKWKTFSGIFFGLALSRIFIVCCKFFYLKYNSKKWLIFFLLIKI